VKLVLGSEDSIEETSFRRCVPELNGAVERCNGSWRYGSM
jgi:hypothetical protein